MKKPHFIRLLLLIIALVIGGGLDYKLLVGFESIKITMFVVSVIILGEVFYQLELLIFRTGCCSFKFTIWNVISCDTCNNRRSIGGSSCYVIVSKNSK